MSETAPALSLASLEAEGAGWLLDCEYRQHSPRTLEERRDFLAKLAWLMAREHLAELTPAACRAFLRHVAVGHLETAGRWGNEEPRTANFSPVKPATLHSYYRRLRTFANWLVKEGRLAASPMARIEPPRVPRVLIEPFTDEQIEGLRRAARRGTHPARDEAILLFLLDTGARASELCSLSRGDFDLLQRRVVVRGKGGHQRALYLGAVATRALWAYLNEAGATGTDGQADPAAALFLADRGARTGMGLTRSGLLDLFERLGPKAGLSGVRCSPHTCRHTFAIRFLRAGGNAFQLQAALGHTCQAMVSRYVHLAHVDVATAQRAFSPVDRLNKRR